MHEARVMVDEDGGEVAAATASGLVGAAPPSPIMVRIDRPFFFALRDVPTGAILFAGRVADPSRL
jgi:serpin B